jgi:hypothetical protein
MAEYFPRRTLLRLLLRAIVFVKHKSMNRNELLALISIAIGVPSLVLIFFSREWEAGILTTLLMLALLLFYLRFNQPPFTVIEIKKILTFRDGTGTDAYIRRPQKAIANHLAPNFGFGDSAQTARSKTS